MPDFPNRIQDVNMSAVVVASLSPVFSAVIAIPFEYCSFEFCNHDSLFIIGESQLCSH